MKEPWCLAASTTTECARTLIDYYAKRWGIESSFRDTKDLRFGMGMSWVRIGSTARRDCLWLLNAFAVVLLTLLGAAGEALGYDRHLKANTAKQRTHSLFRQGCMHYVISSRICPKNDCAPSCGASAKCCSNTVHSHRCSASSQEMRGCMRMLIGISKAFFLRSEDTTGLR